MEFINRDNTHEVSFRKEMWMYKGDHRSEI